MTPAERDRVMRATPYEQAGRELGVKLDCLGVVLLRAEWMGLHLPDPWESLREEWKLGFVELASGFPPGWVRLAEGEALRDGDVLLFYSLHPWVAIVDAGYVWSAHDAVGVYCRPAAKWVTKPAEHWRYDSTSHPQGPTRRVGG